MTVLQTFCCQIHILCYFVLLRELQERDPLDQIRPMAAARMRLCFHCTVVLFCLIEIPLDRRARWQRIYFAQFDDFDTLFANMSQETSVIRQNFSHDVETGINKQINVELQASYTYLSMAYFFDRDDVSLPNISKWLKKQSEEENQHAVAFMKYQNTRGGRIVLQPIAKPEKDDWGSALEAFQAALALEKMNNQSLLSLHNVASRNSDSQMCDFLEEHFLSEQVRSIEEIGKIVAQLKRVGKGLGEFIFDKEFEE